MKAVQTSMKAGAQVQLRSAHVAEHRVLMTTYTPQSIHLKEYGEHAALRLRVVDQSVDFTQSVDEWYTPIWCVQVEDPHFGDSCWD